MEISSYGFLDSKTNTMAEIITAGGGSGKRKIHSLKVDLTPMVDLGFLLVSFFVFTSTMANPKMLSLFLPDEKGTHRPIPESGAVTLIANRDGIYYYNGQTPGTLQDVHFYGNNQKNELRTTLLGLKQALIKANGNDEKMVAVLKLSDQAQFGQLVDLLDEMTICDLHRFSIGELSEQEKSLLLP